MKRVADSLSMASSLKALASKNTASNNTNGGPGDGAKASGGPGDDDDKDLRRIRRQKQLTIDANTLSRKEFNKKYANELDAIGGDLGVRGDTLDDLHKYFQEEKRNYQDTLNSYDEQYKRREGKLTADKAQKQKQIEQEAASRKEYDTAISDLDAKKKVLSEKYKYNADEKFQPVDYVKEYQRGVVESANKQNASGKKLQIKGDETNENTCIYGACTMAERQGVDFSGMRKTNTDMGFSADKKDSYIPIQNKSFRENLASSPYEEIPFDQRQEGDFMAYSFGNTPYPGHMEILTKRNKGEDITFNNFQLSKAQGSPQAGTSARSFTVKPGSKYGASEEDDIREAYAYRIRPEAAEKAYLSKHPEYADKLKTYQAATSSDDYKQYQSALAAAEAIKKKYPQYSQQNLAAK